MEDPKEKGLRYCSPSHPTHTVSLMNDRSINRLTRITRHSRLRGNDK